jgi:putative transposase
MMMSTCTELATVTGVAEACRVLGIPRSSLYRLRKPVRELLKPARKRANSPRALDETERETVRTELNSERFQDQAPREVYATLLDEGVYHCHWRTMYRLLSEQDAVRERCNQLRHPAYSRPELLATAPNQLWSWDITKLSGPVKLTYYYLYVMLDVYSRYVVGWMVAEHESAALAEVLIAAACTRQEIQASQLTIHADRGAAMTAKSVALLMSDLGVTKSHSRPHVADDNPYSEAHFRTLKYAPSYPDRFGALLDARQWSHDILTWYNQEHHHSALALLTPADVHYGRAAEKLAQRQLILQQAYAEHPERFAQGQPLPTQPPGAVWINQPVSPTSLAEPERSPILTTAGTEDRATLESDPSDAVGERCSSGQGTLLCPDSHHPSYIVPESDKLMGSPRRTL